MKVHRCAVLAACALLALRTSLLAQARQPISFERFITLETASDPRPSPDGARVAYGVSVASRVVIGMTSSQEANAVPHWSLRRARSR